LLVITIMALLAGMAMPSLRGFAKSNTMTVATRQLLDDVAFARQKALGERTSVYMVFIPDSFLRDNKVAYNQFISTNPTEINRSQIDSLTNGMLRTYALMTLRSVGDQPGWNHPKYITSWRRLPEGTFIPQVKFYANWSFLDPGVNAFTVLKFETNSFPFPSSDSSLKFNLPCIKFNPNGELDTMASEEFIPLTRGSVQCMGDPMDPNSLFVVETAPGEWTNNYTLIRRSGENYFAKSGGFWVSRVYDARNCHFAGDYWVCAGGHCRFAAARAERSERQSRGHDYQPGRRLLSRCH
jgi:hypothetical protein